MRGTLARNCARVGPVQPSMGQANDASRNVRRVERRAASPPMRRHKLARICLARRLIHSPHRCYSVDASRISVLDCHRMEWRG